jgi:hypothetical protein
LNSKRVQYRNSAVSAALKDLPGVPAGFVRDRECSSCGEVFTTLEIAIKQLNKFVRDIPAHIKQAEEAESAQIIAPRRCEWHNSAMSFVGCVSAPSWGVRDTSGRNEEYLAEEPVGYDSPDGDIWTTIVIGG